MIRYTATGPSMGGCHETPKEIAAQFVARGGEDMQVWDTDYIIDSKTQAAVDYLVSALGLENVEESEED